MTSPIKSIGNSNDEVLHNIMTINNITQFDLDCTYSKGVFYKSGVIPQPKIKSDLIPRYNDVLQCSSTNLPFKNNSFQSIIFDPPFVIGGKITNMDKNSSIIGKRFDYFLSFEELKKMYKNSLKEFYRVLQINGYVVFKCQDVVSSGLNYFSHVEIMNLAVNIGFYPKDLFLLLSSKRINSFNGTKWKVQKHARKYRCYFWVFQKTNNRVRYTTIDL